MEILGIGPAELLFIFLIALIVMGPEDLSKAGRTLGRWMRNIVQSDAWKSFKTTSQELKTLPNRLMREANLEDLETLGKEIQTIQKDLGTWTNPSAHFNRNLAHTLLPPDEKAAAPTPKEPPTDEESQNA